MRSHLDREGIVTLGELLATDLAKLGDSPNVGRKSISDTRKALGRFFAALRSGGRDGTALPAERGIDDWPDFVALWLDRLSGLARTDRIVIQHRAGFQTQPHTLQEIGEFLGVSRERARQLEARGLKTIARDRRWIDAVERRLVSHLHDSTKSLPEFFEADTWFAPLRDERTLFEFFLDRFLDGHVSLIRLDGTEHLATLSDGVVSDAWHQVTGEVEALPFPVPMSDVRAVCDRLAGRLGVEVNRCFHARLDDLVIRDDLDRAAATGFGATQAREIAAFVRAAVVPVTKAALVERFGRCRAPRELVFLERGLLTHRDCIVDFDLWTDRAGRVCSRWMRDHGADRQWSCSELAEVMRAKRSDLPEWFGPWPLAALLESSGRVRYLGRLAVVLPEIEGSRLYLRELLIEIVLQAGAPVPEAELVARARDRRGLSDLAFQLVLQRPPFLETAAGIWGLLERDLPGGTATTREAIEIASRVLETRERGLGFSECLSRLRAHSAIFENWSERMLWTVFRHEPTLRTTTQGAVGLADWEDVRLPPRGAILRQCLEEGGGKASVATVQARIASVYGSAPDAGALSFMGWKAGIQRSKGHLFQIDTTRRRAPRSLSGIPPSAAECFEVLRSSPPDDLENLRKQVDARVRRSYAESTLSEAVDISKVVAIQKRCHVLLDLSKTAQSADVGELVQAAVRYFLIEEDGVWDLAPSGLDDDLAVLDAVAAAVRKLHVG